MRAAVCHRPRFASNNVWELLLPQMGAECKLKLETQQPISFIVPPKGLCGCVDVEMLNFATSH